MAPRATLGDTDEVKRDRYRRIRAAIRKATLKADRYRMKGDARRAFLANVVRRAARRCFPAPRQS